MSARVSDVIRESTREQLSLVGRRATRGSRLDALISRVASVVTGESGKLGQLRDRPSRAGKVLSPDLDPDGTVAERLDSSDL